MARTRVATGIYRDAYGYEIRWRDRGVRHYQRFPADTPLQTLKDRLKLKARRAQASPAVVGSFVRDAVRWLAKRKRLTSSKSERAHLRVWIHRFGKLSRFAITREKVQDAIDFWAAQGYSPKELRHRWRILSQLLNTLDPDGPNPCRGVKLPTTQKRRPKSVSDDTLTAVALQLFRQERLGRLRDAKTRARFLVLATTGVRPIQLMRAAPTDLLWEQRLWIVDPAKGDKGTLIYLNEEMLAAWQLFVAANAWGVYDSRSFSKTLQRNGWPKGIRPYNTRHGVGQSLKRTGADLGDIQDHLGHRSPATTSAFYLEPDLARLKATSERLTGRLGIPAFLPPRTTTTTVTQKAKDGENPPHSTDGLDLEGPSRGRLNPLKRA